MRDAAERQANVDAEIRVFSKGDSLFGANPLMLPASLARDFVYGRTERTETIGDVTVTVPAKPPIEGIQTTSAVGEWVRSSVGGIGFELVDGIDYQSFTQTTKLNIVEGDGLGDGRSVNQKYNTKYEAIVDRYYLENNKSTDGQPLKVGSIIDLLGHDFTVVGVYEPSVLARVKIPLHTLQALLSDTGEDLVENCTFIMVKCRQPEIAAQVIESLKQNYPNLSVIHTDDIPALYSQGLTPVEVFLNVVIGLALVISTLVILLGMYTTIIERTRQIGILKSLGASKRFIILTIEKEAALISVLGVALGYVLAVIIQSIIQANTRLKFDLQPKWLLIAAAIGLLGGILGALYPAIRAANLDAVEAISYD
jgi:putative ABC transport system permease protein